MEYTQVYANESWGERYSIGIKILLATDHTLSKEEERVIRKAADDISDAVMRASMEKHPDTIEANRHNRRELLGLFGQRIIYAEAIPNQYCDQYCCAHLPWFIVTTSIGHIKIGWRKRVIVIDWTKTMQEKSGDELFPNEDVTKNSKHEGVRYIHAWGYEKAKEYLEKVHEL